MRQRIGRLQELMKGLDCLLVTAPEDIFYYTGYMPMKEDGSTLVVMEKGARLFTTRNGFQNKKASVKISLMDKASDFYDFIKNYRLLGFDETSLLSGSYLRIRKHGLKLRPYSTLIKQPRMIKDSEEIGKIRDAVRLTKKALVKPSGTEVQAAARIDCLYRKSGAKNAFETIVAAGKNSSNVHHIPEGKRISRKDMVIVDTGARLNGYCADMTRTFCTSPGKREKKVMEDVKNIQEQLFDFIRPGMKMEEVQKYYENLLRKGGYKSFHMFGHGVGLSVHEAPSKGDVLKEGMVITVEPGVYIRNLGGCRIEDMVLIKKEKVGLIS